MSKKKVVYSAGDRLNDNILKIFKNIFNEIKSYKWQIWIAFKKDFIASYSHTAMGFIWSIILPLIPISAYVMLAQFRVLKTTDSMPFIAYILIGFTIWFFLTDTITTIMNSLRREKGILTKIRYPLSAVVLSHFGKLIFDLLIRVLFSFFILILYDVDIGLHLLFLLFLLIPLILFSFGVGLILLILSQIYRDITNFVKIFFRYGMFVSSVIFPLHKVSLIEKINQFNPFNTYVEAIREFIVFGKINNIDLYLYTSIFSLFIFITAIKFIYVMENRLKAYL